MDQALSQLYPIGRIGQDGFDWWVGQVELTAADDPNNNGGHRFKVRIVGEHPQSKELLDTLELPWANVMMPVNVPFVPGNLAGATPQLEIGCWVVGFYLDPEKQKPLIMGSIGQTPGATTILKNRRPNDLPFTTTIPTGNITKYKEGVVPQKDGVPAKENTKGGPATPTAKSDGTNRSTGGVSDGSTDKDGKPRIPLAAAVDDPPGKEENWCQTVAEKCADSDLQTEMTTIISEMLAELQNNGGQLGDYLVNKYTGGLYSATEVARKYVNKSMFVVQHFIAKVKGFIIEKLENAVKDLINALIYPSETGNILTPVTEFFNKLLKNLGCQMADLGDRLADWLTNVLMDLVTQIYQAAVCQIDTLVNGIISKINSLLEDVLGSILGPLQDILGSIAEPLNIIGGAINYVMTLLGISCSGPDQTCAEYKRVCTDGSKSGSNKNKDFLDGLIDNIDNLFPVTGADYTQYTCEDAYKGNSLAFTTVGFTGGVPAIPPTGSITSKPKIVYSIDDITVEEGSDAQFTVIRSGYTQIASSVEFKILEDQGTATADSDYYNVSADILGFAPNEVKKKITIKTFIDNEKEKDETFFVALKLNSPDKTSGISSQFLKNIGQCIITEKNKTQKSPYTPKLVNPYKGIKSAFSNQPSSSPLTPPTNTGDPAQNGSLKTPKYFVSADKSSVKEGEFIVFSIGTENVDNGTIAFYSINGVSPTDIIGGKTSGQFTVSNNTAKVVVGIEEDDVPEDYETLTFTINGTGATASVLIVPDQDKKGSGANIEDFDLAVDAGPDTTYKIFEYPTVDSQKIITDENGSIISIPIDKSGDPFAEPPTVFVGGNGIGATAIALLDQNGYVSELRVTSSGYNYKKNISTDNNLRCIIDSFTLIRPGIQYDKAPEMYINRELGVAEAIINDDGFVIGARILDRSRTYLEMPEVLLVGGGGYGAKMLPSLVCLDTQELTTVGSTKIGTGRYIDCP